MDFIFWMDEDCERAIIIEKRTVLRNIKMNLIVRYIWGTILTYIVYVHYISELD